MGSATTFAPNSAVAGNRAQPFARIKAIFSLWLKRMQQRQQLAAMNVYEMRDIGLSQADAYNEVQKAPWKA